MELEHSFTVPVPKERAWDVLLDVERVAPCMPGATLDSVDGDDIRGRIKVKVGPISMTYAGTAHIVERDEQAGIVRLDASGKETRGAGTASASVRSLLEGRGQETHVKVLTTLNVTGKPAQFGRGVMNEVGGKLLTIFASNLAAMLAQASEPTSETAGEAAPKAETGRDETPLEDLDLPPRALASLHKAGITTVSQLTAKTGDEVLAIDGIGPASVDEIQAKLAGHGLALGQPPPASAGAPETEVPEAGAAGAGAPETEAPEAGAPGAGAAGAGAPETEVPEAGAADAGAADTGAAEEKAVADKVPAAASSAGPGSAAANGTAGTSTAGTGTAGANGARTGATAAPPRSTDIPAPVHQDEALNLLKVAGMPVLKRSLPVLAGVTAVLIISWRRKVRHRRSR